MLMLPLLIPFITRRYELRGVASRHFLAARRVRGGSHTPPLFDAAIDVITPSRHYCYYADIAAFATDVAAIFFAMLPPQD